MKINRQQIVNAVIGGFFGFVGVEVFRAGNPVLGVFVFVAWFVGMTNSLIPSGQKKETPDED